MGPLSTTLNIVGEIVIQEVVQNVLNATSCPIEPVILGRDQRWEKWSPRDIVFSQLKIQTIACVLETRIIGTTANNCGTMGRFLLCYGRILFSWGYNSGCC